MTLIDKLDCYIDNEDADADLYFDEFPPEQFKATLLKLDRYRTALQDITEISDGGMAFARAVRKAKEALDD